LDGSAFVIVISSAVKRTAFIMANHIRKRY